MCLNGILIILNESYLRNGQWKRDTVTLCCLLQSRKSISHVKGVLLTPTGRRTPLLPEVGNLGPEACISKSCYFFNLLPQAQTPFRFFTNWAPQTQVSLLCQFLTNLLLLCLKSIKAAYFGYFLGSISMRPLCTQLKLVSFLLICLVPILLVQPQELKRGRGGISSSQHYKWNVCIHLKFICWNLNP